MATWQTVSRLALALPETAESQSRDGRRVWRVKEKSLAWERPLTGTDLLALGAEAPKVPILAVHVADLFVKEVLLTSDPDVYFTIPHFDCYAAILVRLPNIKSAALGRLLHEAWVYRAPKRLVAAHKAKGASDSE